MGKYENNVVVKPISCGDYIESGFAIFTNPIAENADKLLKKNVEISPFIIQKKINKIADIRINVFGNSIFTFKLLTKPDILDWRKLNPDEIEITPLMAEAGGREILSHYPRLEHPDGDVFESVARAIFRRCPN